MAGGLTVAVIDSGIDKNHPDLIGKVIAEKNFLADEITADDLLGHGTMVAGIIAGSGAMRPMESTRELHPEQAFSMSRSSIAKETAKYRISSPELNGPFTMVPMS